MTTMVPNYILKVSGSELKTDVTQFIERVEYESADGVVDMATVSALNPDFVLSSSKTFAPGNELDIYMGYGPNLQLIGRVVLMAPRILFPPGNVPVIEVTGYTKDYLMKEQRPDPADVKKKSDIEALLASAVSWVEKLRYKSALHRVVANVVFPEATIRDVVEVKALGYQFDISDIDDTPDIPGSFMQPASMSDYMFVQGLANLTGFTFWVDYDPESGWMLHFKNPEMNLGVQDSEYSFAYNQGDLTTLVSFEPELAFRDHYTSIRVQATRVNPPARFGELIEVPLTETIDQEADPTYQGRIEDLEGDIGSAESLKLFIGDFSFNLKPHMVLRSEEAIAMYARQWFRRMREHFIVGRGRVVGLESLRARQVHTLGGLGTPYDGKYYFSNVRHIMHKDSGYYCEFSARKVLGGL